MLINQDHVDTDLVHPIDPLEKILFDEIDSQGTIADILDNPSTTTGSHLRQERARNFFERLWLYDQAVFDASKRIQNLPATDT